MRFCFCVIIFLIFAPILYAQDSSTQIEYGTPKIEQFITKDLGGESQNLALIQDEKGVLLVANSFGFLTFNGSTWSSFKSTNSGIPISFSKNDKRIYTSGTEFIGYLEPDEKGAHVFYDLKNKLPSNIKLGFIWKTIFKEGKVYFQNDSNVLMFSDDKFTVLSDNGLVHGLFNFENKIHVSTSKGLYEVLENKLHLISNYFSERKIQVKDMFRTSSGVKYFVSSGKGLYTWKKNRIVKDHSELSIFLENNDFMTLETLHDGNLAFGTIKGGFLLTKKNLTPILRLTEKTGMTSNNVRGIYQDYNNNLWLACQSGITKINYPYSTSFYNYNKESFGTVEEIARFKNDLYLGTGKGTYKLNAIKTQDLFGDVHFPTLEKLPESAIYNFATIVVNNKLIYGGQNETNLYDGNKTILLNKKEARKFATSKFHKNVLYMGHKFGFDIIFHDEEVRIKKVKEIPNFRQQVRGVIEKDENNIWLTTVSDGIYKVNFSDDFKDIKITRFGLEDGLPSLRDNLVYYINNNDIVFTTHKGFYKFDEPSQKFVPEIRFGEKYAGGKNEFIYAFNFDKKENAWMHSFRKKVAAVAVKDLSGEYKLIEKPLQDIGKLLAFEILSEPEENVVWFGGSDGLARYEVNKSTVKKDTFCYAVISKVIGAKDSVLVEGHQFDKNIETTLPASERDIRFEVGATDFTSLKEIKYQYFLEGYDENWSDWSSEPFKIYTNLNYGDYTFKVRAKNYSENISIPDNYTFSILPYWYQTTLFRIILLLLIIGFISYVANYFSKRKFVKKIHELELTQKFEKEKDEALIKEKEHGLKAMIEAQEEERSRIARELHDGVVQQIGSVILKSRNLFTNRNLLEEKESQELLESLENSNQDLRNISHQMMPRALKELGIISALNDLLEGSLAYTDVKYSFEHFNIKDRLPDKIEITIYRITQELINNIIKHSRAKGVSVQLFNVNNTAVLIVEDNGVGFSSEKDKKGIGLLNISSRLDMVKGQVNFEPSPKSGTLVTIKIPLE
jgi:signal transduction histidine kinase